MLGLIRIAIHLPTTFYMSLAILLIITYLLLVDGAIYLKPRNNKKKKKKEKVFVIGLSRTGTSACSLSLSPSLIKHTHTHTGTTSLTKALVQLSYKTYHFNRYAVMNDRKAVEAFDAHTDISVIPIFEKLSKEYPHAKFILTLRDERKWARAMIRFVQSGVNSVLFRVHPVPRNFYNHVYGKGWYDYDEEDWIRVWRLHLKRVRTHFMRKKSRFLELNLTEENGNDVWKKLKDFLGVDGDDDDGVFPHQYVFRYTFFVQPVLQLKWWWWG